MDENLSQPRRLLEIFLTFLRLGFTSFGGPIAHLGYFHSEFVEKRKWIGASAFADLVALCQFLPGPASSQTGIALGLARGGYSGAFLAWLGFTIPSAALLTAFAFGLIQFGGYFPPGLLHGFKLAAVVVVAQALWAMGQKLCPDKERIAIAIVAGGLAALIPSIIGQLAAITLGAFAGFLIPATTELHSTSLATGNRRIGLVSLIAFAVLLFALPLAAGVSGNQDLRLIDVFFRAGSLVFGGGHVVLPLLQAEIIETGRISRDTFMAGYGLAQAIPGPLFTISAYLGALSSPEPRVTGALIALLATFLPSFLLIFGVLPFWETLRKRTLVRRSIVGINAAVVGLLLAAFYNPVWTTAVLVVADFLIAVAGFCLLTFWKIPAWAIVGLCAVASVLVSNL